METLLETTEHKVSLGLTAADAVWVATATLHDRYPEATGFSPLSIRDEVIRQNLTGTKTETIYQHIVQHLVATQPRNPNRRRMLTDVGGGMRRLFLPGDDFHPSKSGAQFTPKPEDLPSHLRGWLGWYRTWSQNHPQRRQEMDDVDPLLALVGTGKHLYKDEHADEFISRLRSNWGGVE